MVREHRVLSALEDTAVPVPRALHLGDADSPLGAPFYVMERVVGHICRNSLPAGYAETPEQRAAIGEGLVDVLADLHTIDPAEVGLAEFGRPAGFMERQLRRWSKQWEAHRRSPSCRRSTRCATSSCARCPSSRGPRSCTATTGSTTRSCIPTGPGSVVAVLDWEM